MKVVDPADRQLLRRFVCLPLVLWLTSAATLLALDASATATTGWLPVGSDTLLVVVDTLVVEENDEVLTVTPSAVRVDSLLIVVDAREHQVRLYHRNGSLIAAAGSRGRGPGEFRLPVAGGMFSDGRIWVVEFGGRLTIFPPNLGGRPETHQIRLSPIYGAYTIDGDRLLMIGRAPGGGRQLLHVATAQGEIEYSFFDIPTVPPALRPVVYSAGWGDASVRGDTIAAVFSVSDAIYLFALDGTSAGHINLHSERYRPIPRDLKAPPSNLMSFVQEFSSLTAVHWLPSGEFAVQFSDRTEMGQRNTQLVVNREGSVILEAVTPRRIGAWADTLLFMNENPLEMEKWLVATIK